MPNFAAVVLTGVVVGLLFLSGPSVDVPVGNFMVGSFGYGYGYAPASVISMVSGPHKISLGENLSLMVSVSDTANVSFALYDPSQALVGSQLLGVSDYVVVNFTNLGETGDWSINVSAGSQSITHFFEVVPAVDYDILLLESESYGVEEVVVVNTSSQWSVSPDFQVAGDTATLSGVMYYGSVSESVFGCDLNGDAALVTTYYLWVGDPNMEGVYDTVFIDDDSVLNQSPDSSRRTFLGAGDDAVKCSNYSSLASFKVGYVYSGGVLLVLPPGPSDFPYSSTSNVSAVVLASDEVDGSLVQANLSSFNLRYKNTSGLWVEADFNDLLSLLNYTTLDSPTGVNGLSNVVSFNVSGVLSSLGSSPGEYALIVNGLESEVFVVGTSWSVAILVGDPVTRVEKHDFAVGDSVAFGVTTDASSPNITVGVYDPSGVLEANWSYIGGGGSGIFYENSSGMYLAGLNTSYSPLLYVSDVGFWDVKVTVSSGSEEKIVRQSFSVKQFEVMVEPMLIRSGEPPLVDQLPPGKPANIGIMALQVGLHGGFEKNLESSDFVTIDSNPSDGTNECAAAVVNLSITAVGRVASYSYTGIDNMHNVLAGQEPSGFSGQCMANFTTPSVDGEYKVFVELNTSAGSSSNSRIFTVSRLNTWADPWNMVSNTMQHQFSPGANVTLKLTAKNLETGELVDPGDVVSVELIEVFNPDFGVVTDLVEDSGFGVYTLGGQNASVLWVDLSNKTTGFHSVRYRLTALVNGSTLSTVGFCGFDTKLYDISGYPNPSRAVSYFSPNEDINLTVEVRAASGPVSGVYVYVDSVELKGSSGDVNYSAQRASTESDGRANVTVRATSGSWSPGEYDVRIRVKDDAGTTAYGDAWFEVKSYMVKVMPVSVESGANGSVCIEKTEGAGYKEGEDRQEKHGPIRLTGNQPFVVFGMNESGVFQVTPQLDKSKLYQTRNLHGEPVFTKVYLNVSSSSNCSIQGVSTASYFTLYPGNDLLGEYVLEVMAQDSAGRVGSGRKEFVMQPFTLAVDFMHRGEPVFVPGDVLSFEVITDEGFNVTNASVVRVLKAGGSSGGSTVAGAAEAMTGSVEWLTPLNYTRKVRVTLPSNVSGMQKGEYEVQLRFTISGGGSTYSMIHNQWITLKSLTHSIANMIYAQDVKDFNVTTSMDFDYESGSYGSHHYRLQDGGCPYGVINSSQQCALINRTAVRYVIASDYEDFIAYYNITGNETFFEGFHMIVGPTDFERLSSAKVYVVRNDSQLSSSSLTGYSLGEVIADASGMSFRVNSIGEDSVSLTPVLYARSPIIRAVKANVTRSLSGVTKLGVISERGARMDFNGDLAISEEHFGLIFILYDPNVAGVYDTGQVDSDFDLDFTDEPLLTSGGSGVLLNSSVLQGKKIFLLKADVFEVAFAFNESGYQKFLGRYTAGLNITIPIYSRASGLNVSVARVLDEVSHTALDESGYTVYPGVIGSDGVGLINLLIPASGNYRVEYSVTNPSTGSTEVSGPWDSPNLEVKSFDSESRIFQAVTRIPAFSTLEGSSSELSWWESIGVKYELINLDGPEMENITNNLPENFSGYFTTGRGHFVPPTDARYYTLFDTREHKLHMVDASLDGLASLRNSTGAGIGEVAYSYYGQYPDVGAWFLDNRTVNFSLLGSNCNNAGCTLYIQESQPVPARIQRDIGGCPLNQLCAFGRKAPDASVEFTRINFTQSANTTIAIDRDLNDSTPPEVLIEVINGQPNTTETFTISGDMNEGPYNNIHLFGEYVAHFSLVNLTWRPDGAGGYTLLYLLDEEYNSTNYQVNTVADESDPLVGPSDNYLVYKDPWDGTWYALDDLYGQNISFYISDDANLTGNGPYHVGDDFQVYDDNLEKNITYGVTYLSPYSLPPTELGIGETVTLGRYIITLLDIIPAGGKSIREPVPGEPITVNITDSGFIPPEIEVMLNETVFWVNVGLMNHTVSSNETNASLGGWDSGIIEPGQSFNHTFTLMNAFPYYCSQNTSMTGLVDVTEPEEPLPSTNNTAVLMAAQVVCRNSQDCRSENNSLVEGTDWDALNAIHINPQHVNASGNNTVTLSISDNGRYAMWGYNTTLLDSNTSSRLSNSSYAVMVGSMRLGGVDYNVIALDGNSDEASTDLNTVILSNDTILSADEVRTVGNTTPFGGTNYYLSSVGEGEVTVVEAGASSIFGLPYSANDLGYGISVAEPSAFTGDLANNTANYTFILYAKSRGRDFNPTLINIKVDDDVNWKQFPNDCSGSPDGFACYDQNITTGLQHNETGVIAESDGELGVWSMINLMVKNSSTGYFQTTLYSTWDRNTSEPFRLFQEYHGFWGDFLTNTSNITIGVKVRDLNGNAVQGTVNLVEVYLMGKFTGSEEFEHSISEFDSINYTVRYDGASVGNNSLDADGVAFVTLELTDNTTWMENYGYEAILLVNTTSGSEEMRAWFDLGQKNTGSSGGGPGGETDACMSAINQTVCESETNGRCMWKEEEHGCAPKNEPVVCMDYDEPECIGPCYYHDGQCRSCNLEGSPQECNERSTCIWVEMRWSLPREGQGGPGMCMYVGSTGGVTTTTQPGGTTTTTTQPGGTTTTTMPPGPEGPREVNITKDGFVPGVIMVMVNETVMWINVDDENHTVTHNATVSEWDSGTILPGGSFNYTFTKAGNYSYYCKMHLGMTGVVEVGEHQEPPESTTTTQPPGTTTTLVAPTTTLGGTTTTSLPPGPPGPMEVNITDSGFNPNVIMTPINDTMIWTNVDSLNHTVTSNETNVSLGAWDSGVIEPNASFNRTFTVLGNFSYYCSLHPSMTGVVQVEEPFGPPESTTTTQPPGTTTTQPPITTTTFTTTTVSTSSTTTVSTTSTSTVSTTSTTTTTTTTTLTGLFSDGLDIMAYNLYYNPRLKPTVIIDLYPNLCFDEDVELTAPQLNDLHSRDIKYMAYYPFNAIECNANRLQERFPDVVANGTVIDLNGSKGLYTINRLAFRNFLINVTKKAIDAGADAVAYDVAIYNQYSFDPESLEGFRTYLDDVYSDSYLLSEYNITDISIFDFGQYLRDLGYNTSSEVQDNILGQQLPSGLWIDWERYLKGMETDFIQLLSTELKNYALTNYDREFYIALNKYGTSAFVNHWRTIDYVDIFAGETFIDDNNYPQTNMVPVYKASLSKGKRFWSWNWPGNYTAGNYDLTSIFIAEAYASGGGGLSQGGIDRNWDNPVKNQYNSNVIPTYRFALSHPELFRNASALDPESEVAILYALPTYTASVDAGGDNAYNGFRDYSGAVYLLSDSHLLFDVVFGGDNYRINDTLTLSQLSDYGVVLLPNSYALTDNQVEVLKNYASDGGVLVGIGETGTYNATWSAVNRTDWTGFFNHTGVSVYGSGRIISFENNFLGDYYSYSSNENESGKDGIQDIFLGNLSPYHSNEISTDLNSEVHFFRYLIGDSGVYHLVNYNFNDTSNSLTEQNGSITVPLPSGWSASNVTVSLMSEESVDPEQLSFTDNGTHLTVNLTDLSVWTVVAVGSPAQNSTYLDFEPISETVPGGYLKQNIISVEYQARDDRGLSKIKLYYRQSADNVSYSDWTRFETISVSGKTVSNTTDFDTTSYDGDGFYEFFSRATDNGGHEEIMLNYFESLYLSDATDPPNPHFNETHGVNSNQWQNHTYAPSFTWTQQADNLAGIDQSQTELYWGPWQGSMTMYEIGSNTSFTPDPLPSDQESTYELYLRVRDYCNNINEGSHRFLFKYTPGVPP